MLLGMVQLPRDIIHADHRPLLIAAVLRRFAAPLMNHSSSNVPPNDPAFSCLRTLRIADGPDAVHKQSLALMELKKVKKGMQSRI